MFCNYPPYQFPARSKAEAKYPQLWDGLVGAWCPMLGPGGITTLYDRSGWNRHGTLTNFTLSSAWNVPQINGITLDKINDYITLGEVSAFNYQNNRTISIWFNVSTVSGIQTIFSNWNQGSSGSTGNGWIFYLNGSTLNFWGPNNTGPSISSVTAGAWHLAIATIDGSNNATLRLDNSVSSAVGVGTGSSVNETRVGQNQNSNWFGGSIGDFWIWNRVLTVSEQAFLYSSGSGRGIIFTPADELVLNSQATATPWLYARRRQQIIGGGVI